VSNGREAVDAFAERRPDLVLMDVQMPILDGLLATKEIRTLELEAGGRTPIIALTARAQPNDETLCHLAGMDDHIRKPLMLDLFAEKLAKWLPGKAA
jgi:CheY-like chemotaxis protein